jgi:hypothetical protein
MTAALNLAALLTLAVAANNAFSAYRGNNGASKTRAAAVAAAVALVTPIAGGAAKLVPRVLAFTPFAIPQTALEAALELASAFLLAYAA